MTFLLIDFLVRERPWEHLTELRFHLGLSLGRNALSALLANHHRVHFEHSVPVVGFSRWRRERLDPPLALEHGRIVGPARLVKGSTVESHLRGFGG